MAATTPSCLLFYANLRPSAKSWWSFHFAKIQKWIGPAVLKMWLLMLCEYGLKMPISPFWGIFV